MMTTSNCYICGINQKAMKKQVLYFGYLRVSTKRQSERKGKVNKELTLSQETQLEIITNYIESKGGILVGYEVEIESGTNPDRKVLRKVVNLCSIKGYTLITARLDRLHRNVEAISKLMNSGIDFVFCDFPQANKLTIHIMAAIAEYQAENTRKLINETIQRKRSLSKDGKVETHIKSQKALDEYRDSKKAIEAKSNKAYFDQANIEAGSTVVDKREKGWTYSRIAEHLNDMGKLTRTGKEFTPMAVKLLYDRYSTKPIEEALKQRNAVI